MMIVIVDDVKQVCGGCMLWGIFWEMCDVASTSWHFGIQGIMECIVGVARPPHVRLISVRSSFLEGRTWY